MRRGIYLLPSSITLMGMFSGFYAIVASLNADYIHASWAIVVAGVFDALDGSVARLTKTTSRFGVELDSLSDVIAFGVAPSILAYSWSLQAFGRAGMAVVFLYMACGALRLARFNVQKDSSEKKSFTGMPIPGAAGVVCTTIMFYEFMGWSSNRSTYLFLVTLIVAVFMVSTMRFHSLKELNLKNRKPFFVLVIFVVLLVAMVMHPEWVLFLIGMGYLWGALVENLFLLITRKNRRRAVPFVAEGIAENGDEGVSDGSSEDNPEVKIDER